MKWRLPVNAKLISVILPCWARPTICNCSSTVRNVAQRQGKSVTFMPAALW